MKPVILLMVLIFSISTATPAKGQQAEIEQLLLNIEKLNQLRAILDNMYKGYQILSKGYNAIKDLAQGNFDLHKVFLDGLLQVSPTVRSYKKVVDIISFQKQLVKEYKSAYRQFRSIQVFNTNELDYFGKVYDNLVDRSLKNLDELLMVVTSGELRMNDAERLQAIDRIYTDMLDKLQFLRHFNDRTTVMASQRIKAKKETEDLQRIYGIKN